MCSNGWPTCSTVTSPCGSDTTVFDEQLLDTLVYCCIHTRAVELKPLIIKLYGKYNIPPFMVSGGSNEVRKSIKNADLGTLDDENGEEMLLYSLEEDEEEWMMTRKSGMMTRKSGMMTRKSGMMTRKSGMMQKKWQTPTLTPTTTVGRNTMAGQSKARPSTSRCWM